MTTIEFLSFLRNLGVKVWAEGDKLRYRATENSLSPSLVSELARRKSEILQVLNGLKESVRSAYPPLQPVHRNGQLPLSFSQQRLWFLNQLEPGSAFYNVPIAGRLLGRLDISALERALTEIVRRHEVIRTTFADLDGRSVQIIRPPYSVKLFVNNLSRLPE